MTSVAFNNSTKLQGFVSVTDFGAVGDGVTDDSPAFNAAIAASTFVWVPNPRVSYKWLSPVYVRVGLQLIGAGMQTCVIDGSSLAVPLIQSQLDRYGSGYRNQGLRHGKISGFKFLGGSSDIINIFHGLHRSTIDNNWFYSCGGDCIHIDAGDTSNYGGYYNRIEHNTFGDPTDFSSGSDTTTVQGRGIYAIGSSNMNVVSNNNFWRQKQSAIELVGTLTWSIQKWTIIDNGIEGAGYFNTAATSFDTGPAGVRITGNALSMAIERNYIEACGLATVSYFGSGVYVNNSAVDLTIRDNLTSSNPYAFYIKQANSVILDGNAAVNQSTYNDIYIYSLYRGYAQIGNNPSFGAISGKYLNVATPTQPRIYGDYRTALLRGNTCLASKFTPRLWGGATEITCSTAVGYHEVIGPGRVRFDINLVVSSLNGATGLVGISGSDGINLPMPGLGATIQFPSKNDSGLPAASAPVFYSKVTPDTGYTEVRVIWNQTGTNYPFLRQYGPGASTLDVNLNATSLTVGSTISFSIVIEV